VGEKPSAEDAADAERGIVRSKSNITNNRTEEESGAAGGQQAGPDAGAPGAQSIAIGDPGVNGLADLESDGQADDGKLAGGGSKDEPLEAVNLNSSKSNAARAGRTGEAGEPAEATNLNSSRSNIERTGAPESGDSPGVSESSVKSSKSNTSD
jgi:hypothetical protein